MKLQHNDQRKEISTHAVLASPQVSKVVLLTPFLANSPSRFPCGSVEGHTSLSCPAAASWSSLSFMTLTVLNHTGQLFY